MAESTLSLAFEDLNREVALKAGFGHRADSGEGLSADEITLVGVWVNEGYRTFLVAHEWSFLRPITTSVLFKTTLATTTMTVTSSTTVTASVATFFPTMIGHTIVSTSGSYVISGYTSSTIVTVATDASADTGEAFQITANGSYRLPDDFGGLISDVYYQAADGGWAPLKHTGVSELIQALQRTTGTGRPTMCAVDPLAVSAALGQRHDLLAWRISGADYTIKYQFQVLADKLTATNYPYGGAKHAETIKYACLAAMELHKVKIANGPYKQQFVQLLSASIKVDNRGARANSLGIMGSARPYYTRGADLRPLATNITVEGVSYP